MFPVYFVHKYSNYIKDHRFDAFDIDRNALTTNYKLPAVYHPPCRLFSKLRSFSTAPESEKYLAHWSMYMCRVYGGIVEHPYDSQLWREYGIFDVYKVDEFGGFSIVFDQYDFGFPTRKRTRLYIVGLPISQLPAMPLRLYSPLISFESLSSKARSATPQLLIDYFFDILNIINYGTN